MEEVIRGELLQTATPTICHMFSSTKNYAKIQQWLGPRSILTGQSPLPQLNADRHNYSFEFQGGGYTYIHVSDIFVVPKLSLV